MEKSASHDSGDAGGRRVLHGAPSRYLTPPFPLLIPGKIPNRDHGLGGGGGAEL
jgi:hypothetical protein